MESTTPDGDVAKFIEKRGEGVMLISFNVDNTAGPWMNSRARAIPFIGDARPSATANFAFVHLKKMNGVLLELIDYKWRIRLKNRYVMLDTACRMRGSIALRFSSFYPVSSIPDREWA
jgi:methylmalonyl-CoA/ethylmalonyl-CoA epimerase